MLFNNNKYVLYTKDRPVLSFRCDRTNEKPSFHQEKLINPSLIPFHFKDIGTWIENRRAPKHRKHIKELLDKCNCNDLEGFIRFAYCAGLNDTYWVKPGELDLTWESVSLFRNEFDQNIARLAFGTGLMGEEFTSTTPELATDGNFPKCWKRFSNEIYLLKQGSSGAANAGREPYSEVYAYQLSKLLCSNPLPYDLIRFHKELASRCKLFTSEDIGYTPAISFFNERTPLNDMIDFFDEIGCKNKFQEMMVFDALTLNTDRHLKNFGILYNNNSMEVIDMAPVFDNNLSLCPFAEIEDLKNIDEYMTTRTSAIGDGFNEVAIQCLTPTLKDKLYEIRSFKFDYNLKYSLPEERLSLLESMIHKQAENLLHERLISVPINNSPSISLDQFVITIDKSSLPDNLLSELKSAAFTINDFRLITQSGEQLYISDCEYAVNEYNNKLEIDIYDCRTEGSAEALDIRKIDGLNIKGGSQNISIVPETIEIQIDKGQTEVQTVIIKHPIQVQKEENQPAYTRKGEMLTSTKDEVQQNSYSEENIPLV